MPEPQEEDRAATEPVEQIEVAAPQVEPAAAGTRVFLEGPALIDAGDELVLSVMVSDVEQLFSAPMFISYDPEILEFQRVAEGTFLRSSGTSTVFTTSPNPAQGRIIVGYKQAAGATGATGSGALYQLIFTAKSPGKAVVNLERVNFRDPSGKRLPADAEGIMIEVR